MPIVLACLLLGMASIVKLATSSDYDYGWTYSEEEVDELIKEYKNHALSNQTAVQQAIERWKNAVEGSPDPEDPNYEGVDSNALLDDVRNYTEEWKYALTELYTYRTMKETGHYRVDDYFHDAVTLRALLQATNDVLTHTLFTSHPVLQSAIENLYADMFLRIQTELPALNTLMKSGSYADYIAWNKTYLNNQADIDDLEEQLQLLDYRLKLDPEGIHHYDYVLDSIFELLKDKKAALKDGLVTDIQSIRYGQKLTDEEKEQLENDVAILYYALENGLIDLSGDETGIDVLHSVGMLLVAITVVILAASSIAQELATGSIKSLIIAPCKRWKIFFAKLSSLVIIGAGGVLAVWLLSFIINAMFFGLGDTAPYIFAAGGHVYTIPYPLFSLFVLLIDYVEILTYTLFALMLSAVTRSTAISTGLSIGIYGISGLLSTIINLFSSAEVQKFIPFNHFDLSDRIFSSRSLLVGGDGLSDILGSGLPGADISVTFSLVYFALLLTSLAWIAYDSFTRRDI